MTNSVLACADFLFFSHVNSVEKIFYQMFSVGQKQEALLIKRFVNSLLACVIRTKPD